VRILSVKVTRETDPAPDLSYLGEYVSRTSADHAIDRVERGDAGRNEYRYFIPTMTAEETGNPESPEQDYQRMERYNAGDWYMLGIKVTAEVQFTGDTVQTIRSGGLWGIESDSEESYLKDIEKDELDSLREELLACGFSDRRISAAFKGAILG